LYAEDFRQTISTTVNPYGNGGASEKIVRVLKDYPLEGIIKKSFYDLGSAADLS
jgi:GDP/UDP-N,N'-diacetylbacillosamine 2-epimerase (hydrolysing)